ncbi:hypothetical protein Taro_055809 [Colocasia esculenta]|uniref:Uncharacterized protein n=1 Tax=Colocasia esculenta TaxID=4460 RepID=A0A843XUH0_COLES|nr:hypothetical protein [Colocasia esculenta]
MASHGRRGGAPAHEGEQRREEQAEQQVPAPQGPVLPPPPPVDYGVFMQGLVQAMQTQAHTRLHSRPSWRLRNDPQKTTELFSFGRPKEEKLKSHHHPQREATALT